MANPKLWQPNGKRTEDYHDSLVHQIRLWMTGVSWHNTFANECCPDFSCCNADMLRPETERIIRGTRQLLDLATDTQVS